MTFRRIILIFLCLSLAFMVIAGAYINWREYLKAMNDLPDPFQIVQDISDDVTYIVDTWKELPGKLNVYDLPSFFSAFTIVVNSFLSSWVAVLKMLIWDPTILLINVFKTIWIIIPKSFVPIAESPLDSIFASSSGVSL